MTAEADKRTEASRSSEASAPWNVAATPIKAMAERPCCFGPRDRHLCDIHAAPTRVKT